MLCQPSMQSYLLGHLVLLVQLLLARLILNFIINAEYLDANSLLQLPALSGFLPPYFFVFIG